MSFNSPQELVSHLRDNLDKKYFKTIELIDFSTSPGKYIYTIRIITDSSREDTFKPVKALLGTFAIHKPSSEQTYLDVFFVNTGINSRGKATTTKILIKPSNGLLMIKEPMFNGLLANLSNFKSLKRTPDSIYEYKIVRKFNETLINIGQGLPVHVSVNNKMFYNIIGMVSGPAFAKGDLILIDKDGQQVCFLSHKAGSSPKDFQQYSGISPRAGEYISNNKEVIKFKNELAAMSNEELSSTAYLRKIRDVSVKNKAVFGKDFNRSSFNRSPNNIDFFAQGDINISQAGNKKASFGTTPVLKINFTSKLVHKENINAMTGSNYDPVLGARPGEAYRKVDAELTTIYGVRAGIFPEGYIKNRKNYKKI